MTTALGGIPLILRRDGSVPCEACSASTAAAGSIVGRESTGCISSVPPPAASPPPIAPPAKEAAAASAPPSAPPAAPPLELAPAAPAAAPEEKGLAISAAEGRLLAYPSLAPPALLEDDAAAPPAPSAGDAPRLLEPAEPPDMTRTGTGSTSGAMRLRERDRLDIFFSRWLKIITRKYICSWTQTSRGDRL